MQNGDLYVLHDSWKIDTLKQTIAGHGEKYNYNRRLLNTDEFTIPIDSVAIFETNKKLEGTEESRIKGLSVLAGLDVVLGVICLTVPKACFGSCPTFYTNPNDNFHDANAEGFSNAVTPSLEYTDIDDLKHVQKSSSQFSLWMKNEALETHCIKDITILAVPTNAGESALQGADGQFYISGKKYPPAKAVVDGVEITSKLRDDDRIEWRSEADSTNLSAKQEVIIDFENIVNTENLGLSITFRQSLLVTYLFYSVMGYAGDQVSDLFAAIETKPQFMERLNNGIKKELGNIEVYYLNAEGKEWIHGGSFYEEGPISRNKQVLALGKFNGNTAKIKLVLTKGFWRIDDCQLVELKSTTTPISIKPTAVFKDGQVSVKARNELLNNKKYLISMPGDEYEMVFELPDYEGEFSLFLASTGYYLEWMREQWIKDQDWSKIFQVLYRPKHFLKQQAPYYKAHEAQMESDFWNSKIDTKSFSYD